MTETSTTKFVHYSCREVGPLQCMLQDIRRGFKPNGFWFSVEQPNGYGWREWCESEGFNLENLTHVHDVVMAPDANFLILMSADDLDDFTRKYRDNGLREIEYINWVAVSAEYDGIIIAPYCWERRMHLLWYYGWDCASGVVWNVKAIESVTLREIREIA